MALMATTRRFSFRAVHSLAVGIHHEKLHGHRYDLEVSFGDVLVSEVEGLVHEKILSRLDGRDLTHLMEPATSEVLVEWIDRELRQSPLGPAILGVALQETRKNRFVSAASVGHLL